MFIQTRGTKLYSLFLLASRSDRSKLIYFAPLDTNYVSYTWDFGDGNTSTSNVPSHRYSANGTYNVCLTVDDGNGCVDSFCTHVIVGPIAGPCIADFFAIPVTSAVIVDFSAIFNDPTYSYSWTLAMGTAQQLALM